MLLLHQQRRLQLLDLFVVHADDVGDVRLRDAHSKHLHTRVGVGRERGQRCWGQLDYRRLRERTSRPGVNLRRPSFMRVRIDSSSLSKRSM